MHRTISMASVVKDPQRVFDAIEASRDIVQVKRPGHRTMIVADAEELGQYIGTLEALVQPMLEEAERDIAAGRTYSLDEVLRDLGLERSLHPARAKAARQPSGARKRQGRKGGRASRSGSTARSRTR